MSWGALHVRVTADGPAMRCRALTLPGWKPTLHSRAQAYKHAVRCSALDLSGLELDTEVSDNEEEADADAAAMHTLVDMIARDDNLETPSEQPGPSAPQSAFGAFGAQGAFAKPPRRLAHSQSFPANMT